MMEHGSGDPLPEPCFFVCALYGSQVELGNKIRLGNRERIECDECSEEHTTPDV